MYLYSFTHYPGQDSIFIGPPKLPKKYQMGDLLWVDGQYVLLLGEDISFMESYTKQRKGDREVIEYYPRFLKPKTIEIIHWMTYYRYTHYKKILPLFLPKELDYILSKKPSKKASKEIFSPVFNWKQQEQNLSFADDKKLGQTLIIFPDLWTMNNLLRLTDLPKEAITLTSQATILQQSKAFRGISLGHTSTLITTHSNIFQDRHSLEEIIFVQPHRRYYSNQQEPRYKTDEIVKKLEEIYGCIVKTIL